MPLYEEKFLSPFAIRFSQARIRPTFQDGRLVDRSMSQVEAVTWPVEGNTDYDVFLNAPFPPIEIIRWRPKIREEDGRTCVDEDGRKMLGEACWFTFDNRRLYCLQAAAAKQWPRRAGAIVHIMHDLPLSRSTPRKFRTTDLGCSVRISRRHDAAPLATWSWAEATYGGESATQIPEDGQAALEHVKKDAAKEDWSELSDVPHDVHEKSNALTPLEAVNAEAVPKGTITTNGYVPRSYDGTGGNADAADTGYGHDAIGPPPPCRLSGGGSAASAPAAWMSPATQMGADLNGLNGGASNNGALTVSALAAQFAQAQALAMTASLLPAAGSRCNAGPGPMFAPPAPQPAPQPANATSLAASSGPLLSEPQLLPTSVDGEDDDEENCVQS